MNSNENFSTEQQEYLKGFFEAVSQRNKAGLFGVQSAPRQEQVEETVHGTPIDDLCKEEKIKHELNGLDVWDTVIKNDETKQFPQGGDLFRYKFYGLFHVAPAQDSIMLRCRIPGGKLLSHQMMGLAEITEDWGNGFVDITTRANIQVRELMPGDLTKTFYKLSDMGLTSKGAGADNLRNITCSPTAGYDPQEFIDTLPHAKAMHHAILNNRDLYGLPRKFNISFDGGGVISTCSDTNDIAFYAVKVGEDQSVEPGIYFRVQLCGITGHKQFASDCGILIRPEEAVTLASAMVRVFIVHGDRTNRKKARLKYLIDEWGHQKFLEETQKLLDFDIIDFPLENCIQREYTNQEGHIGTYPQSHPGFSYVGISTPVGRISSEKFKQLAKLADKYGRGEVRLTVWQNLIFPYIPDDQLSAFEEELSKIGFSSKTNPFLTGLVACTGNKGCKYAAADTKGHAKKLAQYLSEKLQLDTPINIHLTGCPHSCAQHYIGDIGLVATKTQYKGESAEGYNIVFGGGVDERQAIAREAFKSVPFQEIPALLENCLRIYLERREGKETFTQFVRRNENVDLETIFKKEYAAA